MKHASNQGQLSLIRLFGVVDHPDADRYNRAFDIFNSEFGMYATLDVFNPNIKSTSQSGQQVNALVNAVSNQIEMDRIKLIDTGFSQLQLAIKNYVSAAQMIFAEREYKAIAEERKRKSNASINADISKQQAEAKSLELLRKLELKEKLLAHESEFSTEKAARNSSLIKQAESIGDVVPVFTEKKIWIWSRDVIETDRVFEKVFFDNNGKSDQGHFIYSCVLTFKEVEV